MDNEKREYKLSTIMFINIQGFSALLGTDESLALDLLSEYNALLRPLIIQNHGQVVKTMGDVILAGFDSAYSAVQAGLEIQKAISHFAESTGRPEALSLRIGIHLGEVSLVEDNFVGEGVDVASRLQAYAQPGHICVSQEVCNVIRDKIKAKITGLGPIKIKNSLKDIYGFDIFPTDLPGASEATRQSLVDQQAADYKGVTRDGTPLQSGNQDKKAELSEKTLVDFIKDRKNGIDVKGMARLIGFPVEKVDKFLNNLEQRGIVSKNTDEHGVERFRVGGIGPANDTAGPKPQADQKDYQYKYEYKYEYNYDYDSGDRHGDRKSLMDLFIKEGGALDLMGIAQRLHVPPHRAFRLIRKLERKGIIEAAKDSEGQEVFRYTGAFTGSRRGRDANGYMERYNRKWERRRSGRGVLGNVISFLIMAPFFVWLNFKTSPQIPWAFIPIIFWFNGVIESIFNLISEKKKQKFFDKVPNLNEKKVRLIERFTNNFSRFFSHFFSYVTVNAFFVLAYILLLPVLQAFLETAPIHLPAPINWTTFLPWLQKGWFVFLVGGWGVGVFSHLIGSIASHFKLKSDLKREGIPLGKELRDLPDLPYPSPRYESEAGPSVVSGVKNEPDTVYTRMLRKAAAARETIVAQINSPDFTDKKWGEDIITVIDNYLKKMELLVKQSEEIDKLMHEMSLPKIDEEIAFYKNKLASDISEVLKSEYSKSLVQWEKHRDSLVQLKEQQEIIHTRLNSSLLALQQFQLNIAKMKALNMEAEGISLDQLKKTSDELTEYLSYLRDSYTELK